MSSEENSYSDSYVIDLFGDKSKEENESTNNHKNDKSTELYLDGTIGDIIGELLEQTSKDTPPDPILHLADLLERCYFLSSLHTS